MFFFIVKERQIWLLPPSPNELGVLPGNYVITHSTCDGVDSVSMHVHPFKKYCAQRHLFALKLVFCCFLLTQPHVTPTAHYILLYMYSTCYVIIEYIFFSLGAESEGFFHQYCDFV